MRYGEHVTEANTVGGDLLPAPERTEILERGGAFTDTRGRVCSPENWKLDAGAPFASAFDHSDGNGNVTFLMYTNGMQAAKYLYDPYGNMLAMSGPLASANKYRFSSKEWNDNAGLYYYLYRFYDPDLQRWVNRDPIQERGGLNLYAFLSNSPIDRVDYWGLRNYVDPGENDPGEGGWPHPPDPDEPPDPLTCLAYAIHDAMKNLWDWANKPGPPPPPPPPPPLIPAPPGHGCSTCQQNNPPVLPPIPNPSGPPPPPNWLHF